MPRIDQGVNETRFMVVPRTLIFIFDNQGRVLLLKGSPDKRIWANLYNGIGGHVEPGEDILGAAKRELTEETGLTDVPLRFCGQIMVDVGDLTGVAIFIFRGTYQGNKFVESDEGSLDWVDLAGINKLPVVEDLLHILPKIAAHRQGDPIIIGHYRYQPDDTLKISLG